MSATARAQVLNISLPEQKCPSCGSLNIREDTSASLGVRHTHGWNVFYIECICCTCEKTFELEGVQAGAENGVFGSGCKCERCQPFIKLAAKKEIA